MWQDTTQNLQAKLDELRGALSFAPGWAVSFIILIVVVAWLSQNTSDLCAEVREKLIGFLLREYPEALPRRRNEDRESAARKNSGPTA